MTVIIKTNQPLIDKLKTMHLVANFWNRTSLGWHQIWGPHIHHGYYDESSLSPIQAQEKLIAKLADLLEIKTQSRILDIGCGMGGSSIYLAEKFNAVVEGITLSDRQVAIATQLAEEKNIKNVTFKIEDALSLTSIENNNFDIAWSLESCEQFYDKEQFLKQVYKKIKPGGKLLLATWCSDQEEYTNNIAKKYKKLCLGFDLPYMPTINHYHDLLKQQNFDIQYQLDWSDQVKQSWEIGINLLNAYSFLKVLRTSGLRGLRFVKQVKLMRDAFDEGRVRYGVFVAIKQ